MLLKIIGLPDGKQHPYDLIEPEKNRWEGTRIYLTPSKNEHLFILKLVQHAIDSNKKIFCIDFDFKTRYALFMSKYLPFLGTNLEQLDSTINQISEDTLDHHSEHNKHFQKNTHSVVLQPLIPFLKTLFLKMTHYYFRLQINQQE